MVVLGLDGMGRSCVLWRTRNRLGGFLLVGFAGVGGVRGKAFGGVSCLRVHV